MLTLETCLQGQTSLLDRLRVAPKFRFILLLLASLLISACTSGPSVNSGSGPSAAKVLIPDAGWQQGSEYFFENQYLLADSPEWQYSAKVGLSTNSIRESANLVWRFSDQSNSVRLFGPLGAGAVKLEFDQYGVVLSDNKGVVHRGSSAEALLTEIIGWPLPVAALSKWLFVKPDLDLPFQYQLNELGQVVAIRQLGWQIDYSAYRDYQGQQMPRKLTATKNFSSDELGLVTVKLVTKSWQL